MLKNVGENIKKILLHLTSFTLWILKILFLTQSFTTFMPSLVIRYVSTYVYTEGVRVCECVQFLDSDKL